MNQSQFNQLNNHLGYGNSKADIVFLGLEEACDAVTINQNYEYRYTDNDALKDLKDFHINSPIADMNQWFKSPQLQPTWGHLNKLLLLHQRMPLSKISKAIKLDYQINKLGRKESNTLLLELLPLPRPNHNYWDSSLMSLSGAFTNQNDYYKSPLLLDRVKRIKNLLTEKPRTVIVYGKSRHQSIKAYFKAIGDPLAPIANHNSANAEEFVLTSNSKVRFLLCPHVIMGLSNDNMISLAKII